MGCSLAELEQRFTTDELVTWLADYQLTPWDEQRIEAVLANGFCALLTSWGAENVSPKDFIPVWDEGDEETIAKREAIARQMFKAEVLRRQKVAAKLVKGV